MVLANTVTFSRTYSEKKEWLRIVYNKSLADWSGKRYSKIT
jgi:hypothetical protein